jgi:uncharacterized protein GlcG (DUF336 family)
MQVAGRASNPHRIAHAFFRAWLRWVSQNKGDGNFPTAEWLFVGEVFRQEGRATMVRSGIVVGLLTAASMVASAASAQSVVTTKQLSVDVADGIAMAAMEQCRKDGFRVSVAVVDRAGNVQVLIRDNGAGPHTADTARRKAYTSASFGIASGEFATRVANPAAAALKDITGVIPLAGAVPIRAGKDLLGGVGVGGAPAGEKDEVCANAGLKKFADQLK